MLGENVWKYFQKIDVEVMDLTEDSNNDESSHM